MSSRPELADQALGLLRRLTGDPASGFRPAQLEAILALAGIGVGCCWCSGPMG